MFNLPKETEVNDVEIDVEDLYTKLKFNYWRRINIARKLVKIQIVNQIDCKETIIQKNHKERIDQKIYIMKFINEEIDETETDEEVKEYMYSVCDMLMDIMEQIGQWSFFVICDKSENIRALFFKEHYSYDFDIIDNKFKLFLDENEDEVSIIYKDIIEQADDYYNLRKRTDDLFLDENEEEYI